MNAVTQKKAVVIGTSAGAVESLSAILPELPEDFPLPVLVVVHLPPQKKSMLAELFDEKCRLKVKEAEDKEQILAGHIYFAPSDYHLMVEKNGFISLSSEEPVLFSRPSIDVLFETAADAYRDGLLGIVLSGANDDGAQGMKRILEKCGEGWVQQPDTAYATQMPLAALKMNPQATPLILTQMVQQLQELHP